MSKQKLSTCLLLFLLASATSFPCAKAEELKAAPEQEKDQTSTSSTVLNTAAIDPEKRKAVDELLKVTEISKRLPLMIDALKTSARKNFALAIAPRLTADSRYKNLSRPEFKKLVQERSAAMTERYLELFYKRVDLDKLVRDVALEVYSKNFSTEELENITEFYKTPTGAKARKVMPEVARESMQLTQKLIRPDLRAIVKIVLEEDSGAASPASKGSE